MSSCGLLTSLVYPPAMALALKTVKDQSAKIQQLEAEKAALVRQMFQTKASTQPITDDDSILSIL